MKSKINYKTEHVIKLFFRATLGKFKAFLKFLQVDIGFPSFLSYSLPKFWVELSFGFSQSEKSLMSSAGGGGSAALNGTGGGGKFAGLVKVCSLTAQCSPPPATPSGLLTPPPAEDTAGFRKAKTGFREVGKISSMLITGIIFLITGCHKVPPTAPTALFGLHLHTYIGTNVINPYNSVGEPLYQQEYADANGRYEYLTMANIYISNVSLHSTTSGWITIPGSLILKRIENEIYVLGYVPATTYDNVRFTIGLGPSLDNVSAASSSGPDTVLNTPTSAEGVMYNGSTNGYYFINVAGFVDTSAGQQNKNPIPFTYQLGGAGDTVVVSPPAASGGNTFTLAPGIPGAQLIHIVFDYGKLLQSFPITAPTNVNSFTTPAAAKPVWDSVPGMIRYECTVPDLDC